MTWNWNSVDNGPHRDLVGMKHVTSTFCLYCEIFDFLGDKFVTLLETCGEIRFIALRVLQTSKGFWVFLFLQSF